MAKRQQLVNAEDLERFAGYNAICTLREEIAIARLALERMMIDANASGHWLAYSEPITNLIETIVRLIQQNAKIDPLFRGRTCQSGEQK